MMRHVDEAIQLANTGLTISPNQYHIANNLAIALLLQGKYSQASSILRHYKNNIKDSFNDKIRLLFNTGIIPKEKENDVIKIMQTLK